MTIDRVRDDGRWLPAEPMPEPFGVLWGRLWHERRRSGERRVPALIRSWLDARAVTKAAFPVAADRAPEETAGAAAGEAAE